MATKQIILHTTARVNGVLRSPPESPLTVTEGEAKRLVHEEKAARLAPGEKWTQSKPRAPKKTAKTAPDPAPASATAPGGAVTDAAPAPAAASDPSASAAQA